MISEENMLLTVFDNQLFFRQLTPIQVIFIVDQFRFLIICNEYNFVIQWRRPKLLEDVIESVTPGCNSKERAIQEDRERAVLCALFFNK